MPGETLSLAEAAQLLGVHYMTVYRYVRTGLLPAQREGSTWRVARSDLTALSSAPPVRPAPRVRRGRRPSLEGRLLVGDEAGAWAVAEAALASGTSPESLLVDLLAPTLKSIGDRWESGELTVADEHRASGVAFRLVGRLGARFNRRGVKRGTVVLAAPAGELHGLPVAIGANVLRWHGYEVVELGADTPAAALAAAVASESSARGPALLAVAVACTTGASVAAAREAVAALREEGCRVPVVMGGAALADGQEARRAGADIYSGRRADELLAAVDELTRGPRPP
jgi:excisionase family DNA binding protein